jgi:hypothetical protein
MIIYSSKFGVDTMKRRNFVGYGLGLGLASIPAYASSVNKWGADAGYPTGWGGGFSLVTPQYRVGNYSGGFEGMLPHHVIQASDSPVVFNESYLKDFKYRWGLFKKSPEEYLDAWSTTGLLICRDSSILYESYRRGRSADMRFTSFSMAKSVTSLLLGICIDKKLIESYDDSADKYVPELKGTLHGEVTLRNLSNMSSGADILHDRDNMFIYPSAFVSPGSNIAQTVVNWNRRREEQGRTYNYNELCPLTIGMVIRKVAGSTLSEFAQRFLWQPLGAEKAATWTTDSFKNEFNCIGYAATLRDWGRLGVLVANRGRANGNQVISEAWIRECTSWGDKDKQVRVGVAYPRLGYKAHMWHIKGDGSRLYFNGHHGQRVIIDMPTRTVLVHTAVDHDGNWQAELFDMFEAATRL